MIVDINVAHKALLRDNDPDFRDIYASLFRGKMPNAKIVYGGHLTTEYLRSNVLRKVLAVLDRAGRARKVDDNSVNKEAVAVTSSGLCQSDDQHIIALARVGNVRLLCSHDTNLHTDFTNKHLLSNPRGKVYQNPSHNELLRTACQ